MKPRRRVIRSPGAVDAAIVGEGEEGKELAELPFPSC